MTAENPEKTMTLPAITLSTLHSAARDAASFGATHVLSVVDPDQKVPEIGLPEDRHLVLR